MTLFSIQMMKMLSKSCYAVLLLSGARHIAVGGGALALKVEYSQVIVLYSLSLTSLFSWK